VARVELTEAAADDLERLTLTHNLPPDTKERLRRRLESLERFPLLGPALEGRWKDYRYVLGRWRWMVVVYECLDDDRVVVTTIQDGRSKRSPTSSH
jgi:plasmid stabilization system protein ParE